MKKRRIIVLQITFFLIVCIISSIVVVDKQAITASSDVQFSKTVILDAGHGGLTNTID